MSNNELTATDHKLIKVCLTCTMPSCRPDSKLCQYEIQRKVGHAGILKQHTCGFKVRLDDVDVRGWEDARRNVNKKMGIKVSARMPGQGITFGRRRR